MRGSTFIYNNLKFSSKKDCCAFYGITEDFVRSLARKRGISFVRILDNILSDDLYVERHTFRVKVAHHYWSSIDYCCKSLGINLKNMLAYLYSNMESLTSDFVSVSYLIENYVRDNNGLIEDLDIEIDGKQYNCARYCYDNGIKWNMVCLYVAENDVTVEEAISECSKTHRFAKTNYRGINYDKVFNLYYKLGVVGENCGKIHRAYNIPMHDALDYCVLHDRLKIRSKGTNFIRSNVFNCSCNNCGEALVLTKELAFQHINECYGSILKHN